MNPAPDAWMSLTGDERDLVRVAAYIALGLFSAYLLLAAPPQGQHPALQPLLVWLVPVYLLLAANALLHGDDLFGDWARALLVQHHWYEGRRVVQGLLLVAVTWVGLRLLRRPVLSLAERELSPSASVAVLRAAALCSLTLALLRFVSFHYTDSLLHWPLLGLGLGSWLEALALLAAGAALLLACTRSPAHV